MSPVVNPTKKEKFDNFHEQSFEVIKDLFRIDNDRSIRVGLMNMPTSLDLHVLFSDSEKLISFGKIELTGKRKKTDPIQALYDSYLIKIHKEDRGKVIFRLLEPELQYFELRFSSFQRAGQISVDVNTRNLDKDEKPLIGATNQTFENLVFPRKPIHLEDIEILKLALETKSYRTNGLLDPDSMREFCQDFKKLSENWHKLQPRERIFEIRTISNRLLMKSGVYPCYFPEGYVASWKKFSPHSLTHFSSREWSLYRSPTFVDKNNISFAAMTDFAACLYKELRHVEQTWLVLRYLAKNYPGLLKQTYFDGAIGEVKSLAQKFPIDSDPKQQEFCSRIFEDMTTDLAARLNNNYLGNNFQHPFKLTIWQRLKITTGKAVLFHERDAIAAKKAVEKYFRKTG